MSANPVACRLIPALLLALLPLGATGCQTWHTHTGDIATVVTPAPVSPPPNAAAVPGLSASQSATPRRPEPVRYIRVTTPVRGTFDLWNPRVANDSLFGELIKQGPETGFSLGEVTSVQTRGSGTGKTVLLVSGVVIATSIVALAAVQPCVTMC